MKKKIIHNYSIDNLIEYGQLSFHLGILCLPSLLPISIIFLLLALGISILIKKTNFKKDKWNLSLLIIYIIMIISSLKAFSINPLLEATNKLNIIIDLLKWLILFLSFSSFQIYLKEYKQRKIFAKVFVLSSIPLLISCALQYWFKVYGPFNFFNGLIIWYNKPIIGIDQGVAGLFSNQNYTGFWLSILWPFSIYFVFKNNKFDFRKVSSIVILLATIFFVFLTTSRSAILGLLVSIPIIFSLKILIKILLILLLIYLLITLLPIDIFNDNNLIPSKTLKILHSKIVDINFNNLNNITRIKIWTNTLYLISQRPIFGFGAGLFPYLYLTMKEEYMAQHSHNIVLQIAFEYGIPISFLLMTFTLFLLFKSWTRIINTLDNNFFQINLLNKCWYAATFVALISQLTDVTYFEGKISIIIWILLAGLKCIVDDNSKEWVNKKV